MAEINPMSPGSPSHSDQAHAEANQWTLRGIALLEIGRPENLIEAQMCFEKAISLREILPLDQNPLYRWGLTAGWMNRADALTRLGGPEWLKEALRSYDIAIAHLHRLPLDADAAFRWRLSLAWMNRGITEQALSDEPAQERALRCFDTAIQVMRGHENSPRLDYRQVQAAAWMNRAGAMLQVSPPRWPEALDAARRALHHSRSDEAQDRIAAEAGIKARHTLCRCLAHLLETPPVDAAQADLWILEATDAVEEAMNLTNHDTNSLRLREDFFRFGCRIYRAFQPHFLAEFLRDGISAGTMSETMLKAAHESLNQAAFQIQQENLASCTPGRLDRLIQTLQSLSEAGRELGLLTVTVSPSSSHLILKDPAKHPLEPAAEK